MRATQRAGEGLRKIGAVRTARRTYEDDEFCNSGIRVKVYIGVLSILQDSSPSANPPPAFTSPQIP